MFLSLITTKVRTLLLFAVLFAGFLWAQAQPASITGVGCLLAKDAIFAPAVQTDTYSVSLAVEPLPLGLPELSRFTSMIPLPIFNLQGAFSGVVNTEWLDLEALVLYRNFLGENFTYGVTGGLAVQRASGFSTLVNGSVHLSALAQLSPQVGVAFGIRSLLSTNSYVTPRITLAAYVESDINLSLDISAGTSTATSFLIVASYDASNTIRIKGYTGIHPTLLGFGVRAPCSDNINVIADINMVLHIGTRTMVGVEFLP